MSFQIVEFPLDTGDNVIHRKVIAPSFKTRDEAIAHVKSINPSSRSAAIELKNDSWWVRGADGDRKGFIVEGI